MATVKSDYPDYPVFKGLQKPLEFLGLRGRYIVWAAITVGGGLLSFMFGYMIFGFLISLTLMTAILSVGGVLIFVKQHKGLHTKKVSKGIYIFCHSRSY
ncbi:MAG: DUF4133 domain-containing protein [Prevotella sp.]|nr:DUF4133 domain-containing protein [Prevotella sp.]